jgi:Rieske Fe-S protein
MIRRVFLSHGLMLLGLGRRVWAQVASTPRFARLTIPVRIPVGRITGPWRPVPFTAEGVSPPTGDSVGRRVLLYGVLFKREAAAPDDLSALCLTCPHEQCQVEIVSDRARLDTIEGAAAHPVFLCGCHESVFDAQHDGKWLAGPAPRGLYRFRVTQAGSDAVEINEVEEAALSEV